MSGRSQSNTFFIVGCPRSGTTLLQAMLHHIEDIAVAPETFFMRRLVDGVRKDLPGIEDVHAVAWDQLLKSFFQLPEIQEMGLADPKYVDLASEQTKDPAELFVWLLETYCREQGAKTVGEKTPNHLLYIKQLKEIFPGCRFLIMLRDPRAVVSSWKKVPWSNGLEKDALVWNRYANQIETLGIHRPEIHLVQYEKLVTEPKATVKDILSFLQIEAEAKTIEKLGTQSSAVESVNLDREPWKANIGKPLDTSRIHSWKQDLSASEVGLIESICARQMKRHGYQLSSSPLRRLPVQLGMYIQKGVSKVQRVLGVKRKPVL